MKNKVFLNMFRIHLLGEVVIDFALVCFAAFLLVCKITFVKCFFFTSVNSSFRTFGIFITNPVI